jgi:hypothetical protein
MIFVVIGIGFKSDLLLVKKSIDTDRYIHNLDRLGFIWALHAKYGRLGWIFQQDGAAVHTSQKAFDWPANSPDSSLFELLWTILRS